mmetsp:Transcript_75709/g.202515  ORF Transcript_75709/g.202515 Transcript_75709/m.202515 type:complete len:441 (+) Transcript_75709:2-1324(+)
MATSGPRVLGLQQEELDAAVEVELDHDDDEDLVSGGRRKRHPSVLQDGVYVYIARVVRILFCGHCMSALLLAMPLAVWSRSSGWPDEWVFVLSLLALCPLAERISFVTEDVAKYTSDGLGGLLNATFGNVTELIVSIFALKAGLIRVVQISMLGSILSNCLLVLGCAFLVGGLKHKEQSFNREAASTNCGLLVLAVTALAVPTLLSQTRADPVQSASFAAAAVQPLAGNLSSIEPHHDVGDLGLSRFISAVLLLLYVLLIYFQLGTHSHLFEGDDDDDDPPVLGLWGGIVLLAVITVAIAVLSEFIVDAIEGAAENLGVPVLFIGTILLPIVGNAAEHAAAIIFGYRDKMEIALGIAIGSSVQIGVFVIPLCVVLGWAMGQPMDLNFHQFEVWTCLLTTLVVTATIQDGRANWLKGVALCCAYLCVAAGYWYHEEPMDLG